MFAGNGTLVAELPFKSARDVISSPRLEHHHDEDPLVSC